MKMVRACTLLLGAAVLSAAMLAASAQDDEDQNAFPYEEELEDVREPLRTLVLAVSSLLGQLGVSLALVVASAIKFVVLLLHVIGNSLGKETELAGPIRELEAAFSRINASLPEEAKSLLAVLVHKIGDLLKCVLKTVSNLLGALLNPQSLDPGNQGGPSACFIHCSKGGHTATE